MVYEVETISASASLIAVLFDSSASLSINPTDNS